jgi:hypothetical protein
MAYYYMKNKTSTTNISVRDIYKLKGIYLDYQKPNNYYLGAWSASSANTTESSYLGHAINPWQSAELGILGTTPSYTGMMVFNSPSASGNPPPVGMELLQNYDYRGNPYDFGRTSAGPYSVEIAAVVPNVDTIDDAAQAPGYNAMPLVHFYNISRRSTERFEMYGANFLTYNRRSITSARFGVGYVDFTGNVGNGLVTKYEVSTISDLSGVNAGVIGMLNKAQGDVDINQLTTTGGQFLGASAPGCFIYRNTSNTGRYSILTLNYMYSGSTPTISVGANAAISGAGGNEVFSHGTGINMGKGQMWAFAHRGANWLKAYYVRWSSGTTAAATGAPSIVSFGSTTTIQNAGTAMRLSDELVLWIGPTRNGASSGNSRRIVAHSIYNNSGVPAVRGTFLDTYDWGTTTTLAAASAAGSSDRDDLISGLTVWGRTDTAAMHLIGWSYAPSTNTFSFDTTNQISSTTPYQTNSYRLVHSVVHLGYMRDNESNYYHVACAGDAGDYILNVEQNVSDGTLSITSTYTPSSLMGTAVRRSHHTILGAEGSMPWFINQDVTSNYSGPIHLPVIYNDTSNFAKIGGVYYNLPGL